MKTEKELAVEILKITMDIQKEFPELSKFASEMPITIPNREHPQINAKTLGEYLDSLNSLFRSYAHTHTTTEIKSVSE